MTNTSLFLDPTNPTNLKKSNFKSSQYISIMIFTTIKNHLILIYNMLKSLMQSLKKMDFPKHKPLLLMKSSGANFVFHSIHQHSIESIRPKHFLHLKIKGIFSLKLCTLLYKILFLFKWGMSNFVIPSGSSKMKMKNVSALWRFLGFWWM